MNAKDILASLPEDEPEDYVLPSGAVLKIRGIRSWMVLRDIVNQIEGRKALATNRHSEEALYALEMFTRGVVEPAFKFSEAVTFAEKAGNHFGLIIRRIQELTAQSLNGAVKAAKEEVLSDPTCTR